MAEVDSAETLQDITAKNNVSKIIFEHISNNHT